jgi:Ca2+-binding RTX toxin-like protein
VNALGFVKMASTKTENGITYNVYIHSDANTDAKAALWVQRGILVKSKVSPAPSNLRVSTPPPPSTRARLPALVCSDLIKLGDNSQYAIDYLGDKNANTLTGTHSDEIFVAGAGNDTLTGNGGMDNQIIQTIAIDIACAGD